MDTMVHTHPAVKNNNTRRCTHRGAVASGSDDTADDSSIRCCSSDCTCTSGGCTWCSVSSQCSEGISSKQVAASFDGSVSDGFESSEDRLTIIPVPAVRELRRVGEGVMVGEMKGVMVGDMKGEMKLSISAMLVMSAAAGVFETITGGAATGGTGSRWVARGEVTTEVFCCEGGEGKGMLLSWLA